jgi:integrase
MREYEPVVSGKNTSPAVNAFGASSRADAAIRLMIPIHPRLKECIDAWEPSSSGHFLTSRGLGNSPYSAKAFSSVMSTWREAAGLPAGLSPHGLRKAAARRLAEAGCTPHQIAAITGHKTLSEVTRYTRDVRQVKLAREAIEKLGKC